MADYWNTMILPMLEGAKMTLLLFIIAILVSIPLGFMLTLAAKSRIKPLALIAHTYIYVMRGTPLLLQLLVICFGLPMLPVVGEYLVLDRFVAACLGFILNYAAYFAEIFRGGLLAIDKKYSMRLLKCLVCQNGKRQRVLLCHKCSVWPYLRSQMNL